jgi:hypothetical protein
MGASEAERDIVVLKPSGAEEGEAGGPEEHEAALERGVGEEKVAVESGGGDAGYGGVGKGTPPTL